VSAAVLSGLVIDLLLAGIGSMRTAAVVFSTGCATVACFAMLVDSADLWVRGRRLTPYSVKMLRSLVFVTVLVAVATSFVGRNTSLIMLLLPAMLVYLFVSRRPPSAGPSTAGAPSRSGRPQPAGSAKARQRRGGKKHK
jgi:hypothetical protein